MGKIERWKEKLLSPTGKEVLIKSIIQAIPSYAISTLLFPKGFYEELTANVTRFWWSRNGRDKSIHQKSWEMMTKSKKYGV